MWFLLRYLYSHIANYVQHVETEKEEGSLPLFVQLKYQITVLGLDIQELFPKAFARNTLYKAISG